MLMSVEMMLIVIHQGFSIQIALVERGGSGYQSGSMPRFSMI